ncbi:Cytoskeleton-associated protein 2 C-terminus [Mactra antiquata]
MEKSKAETYMERLKKWREEKKKDKENKVKQKLPKQQVSKPVFQVSKQIVSKPQVKPTKKQSSTVLKTPTIKKRNSEDSRQMLAKLSQWKEEKLKSEKKQAPASVTKSKLTSEKCKTVKVSKVSDTKNPNFVKVKSRLFDYLNKPSNQNQPVSKPVKSLDAKQNENCTKKNSCNKLKPTVDVRQQTQKTGLKRRHSEINHTTTQKKPTSILKRKSCAGIFDLDNKTKSSSKRRRISDTASENVDSTNDDKQTDVAVDMFDSVETDDKIQEPVTPGLSSRNVRFVTPPGTKPETKQARKTPKTPATRKAELNAWLKSKGRTPSKFRHLMCFHEKGSKSSDNNNDPHTKSTLSVDELSEQMNVLEQERLQKEAVEQMDSMLDECMILFEAGCPAKSIVPWLDDIYTKVPVSKTSARFYSCKANVVKYSLDIDAVLEIFEQATLNNAQPKEEIAKCLSETVKYVTDRKVKEAKKHSRQRRRSEVQEEHIFESSSVVYTMSNVTPFSEGKKSSSKKRNSTTQCQVVTPVRRSTRRSLKDLPDFLKDNKKSYTNLEDVEDKSNVLYQPNKALDDIFDELLDDKRSNSSKTFKF